MVEPSISVTIALEPFATSVSHPCPMLMSPTWTSCALPAMNRYSRGAIFHTMSVPDLDVTYLTHFHSLQGYYVWPMSEAAGKPEPSLLKPGIDSPMKVPGQMTSQSQVSTDDLLVLHFILQCLDGIRSPPHLLYQYMQGFIHASGVVYEEISFNLETLEQVVNHRHAMNERAQHLSSNKTQCVVIFIMNHSDEDRGDLFVSPGSCATVAEVSE